MSCMSDQFNQVNERIQQSLRELAELPSAASTRSEFYGTLLAKTLSATAFDSGSISLLVGDQSWTLAGNGEDDFDLENVKIADAESERCQFVLADGRTLGKFNVYEPCEGLSKSAGPVSLVLSLQKEGEVLDDQKQGVVQFVGIIRQLFAEFENRIIDVQGKRDQLLQLSVFANQSNELNQQSYDVCQRTRLYVDCDRVSILKTDGKRTQHLASSSVDSVDERSSGVKELVAIVNRVLKSDQRIEFELSDTTRRFVRVLPHENSTDRERLVLVCEDFAPTETPDEPFVFLSEQAATVIANPLYQSSEFEKIPLRKSLQRVQRFKASGVGKWLVGLGLILATALLLGFYKVELKLTFAGHLQPVELAHLFAPQDGVIEAFDIAENHRVTRGKILVQMSSEQIEKELRQIDGQSGTIEKQIDHISLTMSQLDGTSENVAVQSQLAGEIEELRQQRANLEMLKRFQLLQKEKLSIKSNLDGQVVDQNYRQSLLNRPVKIGERLLTVANMSGEWEMLIEVDDRRLGYVQSAFDSAETPLMVEFRLISEPSQTFEAAVNSIQPTATTTPNGPVVFAKADFDKGTLNHTPLYKQPVSVRISCGKHPLGYVLFHDLIGMLRRKWLLFR